VHQCNHCVGKGVQPQEPKILEPSRMCPNFNLNYFIRNNLKTGL